MTDDRRRLRVLSLSLVENPGNVLLPQIRDDSGARYDPSTFNLFGFPQTPPHGPAALVRKLKTGLWAPSLLLLGDSTGDATTEWFYGLSTWLAAFASSYKTQYRVWNDTTQAYDQPSTIGAGSGVDRYATIVLNTAQNFQCPDSAATSPTGDISVRCKVELDDWTPSSTTDLAGKSAGAGQRSWWLSVTTTGLLSLTWSADGTATIVKNSTVAVPFADGATGWVRADLDVDNGATGNTVKFYTSTNGTTWTQLGADVVTASTTSVFNSTATTQFVGQNGGTWVVTGGKAYAMQLFSGTALVIDMTMGTLANNATTMTDFLGNVWTAAGTPARAGDLVFTIFNGSMTGQNVAYANDSTRFPKLTPYPADVVMISYGHNESGVTYAGYSTLTSALLAKWATTGIVPVLQNPETASNTQAAIDAHAMRMDLVASLAAVNRWPVVDAYRAILDSGYSLTDTIADGTNPTGVGTDVWVAEAKKIFKPWM